MLTIKYNQQRGTVKKVVDGELKKFHCLKVDVKELQQRDCVRYYKPEIITFDDKATCDYVEKTLYESPETWFEWCGSHLEEVEEMRIEEREFYEKEIQEM